MPRHTFDKNAQFVRLTELDDTAENLGGVKAEVEIMLPADVKRYNLELRLKALGIDPDDLIDFIDDRYARRGTSA